MSSKIQISKITAQGEEIEPLPSSSVAAKKLPNLDKSTIINFFDQYERKIYKGLFEKKPKERREEYAD
jgi:hypothetical protein